MWLVIEPRNRKFKIVTFFQHVVSIPKECLLLIVFSHCAFQGFQDYYDNVGGSLDDNARCYAKIVDRFKGKTSLLGYEVFNEPFTGDFFKDVKRLLPGVAGNLNTSQFQ